MLVPLTFRCWEVASLSFVFLIELSTSDANCTTGEVRLMIGTELSTNGSGRLEVCFNAAWGTVCETSFDHIDAAVACDQITGFQRSGMNNYYASLQ